MLDIIERGLDVGHGAQQDVRKQILVRILLTKCVSSVISLKLRQ